MANLKKITSEQLRKIDAAVERERRKAAGYFDGRFAPKTVPDKKKESNKKACRNFKLKSDE